MAKDDDVKGQPDQPAPPELTQDEIDQRRGWTMYLWHGIPRYRPVYNAGKDFGTQAEVEEQVAFDRAEANRSAALNNTPPVPQP